MVERNEKAYKWIKENWDITSFPLFDRRDLLVLIKINGERVQELEAQLKAEKLAKKGFEMKLVKLQEKCKNMTNDLQKKKDFVDKDVLKQVMLDCIPNETFQAIYKKRIYLGSQSNSVEKIATDIISDVALWQEILDAAFSELQANKSRVPNYEMKVLKAGPNIYTNGEQNFYNTKERRKELLTDARFRQGWVKKLGSCRYTDALHQRAMIGKC